MRCHKTLYLILRLRDEVQRSKASKSTLISENPNKSWDRKKEITTWLIKRDNGAIDISINNDNNGKSYDLTMTTVERLQQNCY